MVTSQSSSLPRCTACSATASSEPTAQSATLVPPGDGQGPELGHPRAQVVGRHCDEPVAVKGHHAGAGEDVDHLAQTGVVAPTQLGVQELPDRLEVSRRPRAQHGRGHA